MKSRGEQKGASAGMWPPVRSSSCRTNGNNGRCLCLTVPGSALDCKINEVQRPTLKWSCLKVGLEIETWSTAWCNDMKQRCIRKERQKLSTAVIRVIFRHTGSSRVTQVSSTAVDPGIGSSSCIQTWHTFRSPSCSSWSLFLSFIILTHSQTDC